MAKDGLKTVCSVLVLAGVSSMVVGAFLKGIVAGCITLGMALILLGILGRASLERE